MMSKATYEALGFAGGVIIAVGLLPQIIKTVLTRSAADISYSWQAIYAVGISITLVYAYGLKILPVAVPLTLELAFVLTLAALKFTFDRRAFKKIDMMREQGQGDDAGAQELIGGPQSPSASPVDKASEGHGDRSPRPAVRPAMSSLSVEVQQEEPEAFPFVQALNVGNSSTPRSKAKKTSSVDDNNTWHGGPRIRPNSPLLRTISMQEGGSVSRDRAWQGTRRVQRLGSGPTRILDEEQGRVSPPVVVRVIDPQSPLQRWL